MIQLRSLHPENVERDVLAVVQGSCAVLIRKAHVNPHRPFLDHIAGFVIAHRFQGGVGNEIQELLLRQTHDEAGAEHLYRGVPWRIGNQGLFPEDIARPENGELMLHPALGRLSNNRASALSDNVQKVAFGALLDDHVAGGYRHRLELGEEALDVVVRQAGEKLRAD